VRRFDLLDQAVRRAGARKVIFGSDGPWLHPGVELAKIKALGLAPADEQLVLGGNLARLIRAARPPASAGGVMVEMSPSRGGLTTHELGLRRDADGSWD
jgi:hypothetical protein